MFLAPAINNPQGNSMFWALGAPWGGPKGVRAGPGTPILNQKHQKCSQTGRRASIRCDIRTMSILTGLRSLSDASRAPKRPKMAR